MKNSILVALFALSFISFTHAATTTTTADVSIDANATLDSKCGFVADSKATSSTGKKVDPLDAYIDCATQMDYKLVYDKLSATQKEFLVERCMMFEIQNEMGTGGEASMSTEQIQSYESMIKAKCKCIQEGKIFTRTGMSGSCSAEVPKDPVRDLFMHSMDKCTEHLDKIDNVCTKGATNGQTETPGAGVWEESCKNDLRYQCYQFLTIPSVFQEPVNPVLNKCNFGDQTKIISQQCRSYCYQHNTCAIGAAGSFDGGGGGLGNDAIDPKFKNRKIGNIYLLRKLGMSSCVKGTSFGIESNGPTVPKMSETGEPEARVFSLYADQSCYAEIAVQYKDPDCGFRPTCAPLPAQSNGQNLPQSGVTVVTARCDGTGTKNMGKNDPDGVYCEVKVPDSSAPAVPGLEVLSVLPDDTKTITNINSLELIKKFGPAKCNPGGNGSPKDYQPKDYRSEERGMGIQVRKGCQADFKVTVSWVKKLCTMAGEKSNSDTCCQSLVWDRETKTCNSPNFDVPALADVEKVKLKGESCRTNFDAEAATVAAKYMAELGAYDQMFTILNAKADEYFKTIQAENHNAKFDLKALPKAPDATYDMIKKGYDTFWKFKQSMINSRKTYIDATNLVREQLKEFASLIGTTDGKEMTPEQKAKLEKNIFHGSIVQEAATKLSGDMMNDLENAYTQSVVSDFNTFQIEMYDIEQAGLNLAWLCAHKENCTLNNWLIKNNSAEDPAVIDYFLDPIFPSKIGPTGKLLPTIGGVSRILTPSANYVEFENRLSDYDTLKKYFHYTNISTKDLPQLNPKETSALQLFRRFSTELPLRKDSLMKGSSIEKYLDAENNSENKNHLPYYCKAQEDGFEIRVPVGKALEPMRILQISEVLKTYFQETNRGVQIHRPCQSVNAGFGKGVDVNSASIKAIDGSSAKIGGDMSATAKLLELMNQNNQDFATGSSFGSAFSQQSMSSFAKSALGSTGKNGTSGGSIGDAAGAGGRNAISYEKFKEMKKKKQLDSIAKRKISHKDKLIQKHVNSLASSFGKALSKRDLGSVGSSLFRDSSNSQGSSNNSSGSNKDNSGSASYSNSPNSSSGVSGDYYTTSGGGSSGSSGGRSGSYGTSTGGNTVGGTAQASGREQSDLQDAIKGRNATKGDDKYKANEDDSIFEVITKAYIRNYDLLDKRKSDK